MLAIRFADPAAAPHRDRAASAQSRRGTAPDTAGPVDHARQMEVRPWSNSRGDPDPPRLTGVSSSEGISAGIVRGCAERALPPRSPRRRPGAPWTRWSRVGAVESASQQDIKMVRPK